MSEDCPHCVYEKNEANCRGCFEGSNYRPKPITNADRIRSMTDEELAWWLERIRLCCANDLCGRSCPFSQVCYSNAEQPTETLDWLKEEAMTNG